MSQTPADVAAVRADPVASALEKELDGAPTAGGLPERPNTADPVKAAKRRLAKLRKLKSIDTGKDAEVGKKFKIDDGAYTAAPAAILSQFSAFLQLRAEAIEKAFIEYVALHPSLHVLSRDVSFLPLALPLPFLALSRVLPYATPLSVGVLPLRFDLQGGRRSRQQASSRVKPAK